MALDLVRTALLASHATVRTIVIVGEQIRIEGTVEGAEDVVIRGRVEGAIRVDGIVTVEAGAWVLAEVVGREVIVRGTLRGNARASEAVDVARTGRMVGDATAPRVTIAAGAGFRGRVEMGEAPAADAAPPPFAPRSAPPAPGQLSALAPVRSVAPAATVGSVGRPTAALADHHGVPPLMRPGSRLKRRAD